MQTSKSNHFTIFCFPHKILFVLICCFTLACNRENNPQQILSIHNPIQISAAQININTATAEELQRLPHVGAKTAQDIIEHREQYGRFRKPEHLLLIPHISDRRFRGLKNLIKVDD